MPVVRTDVRSVARAVYCHVITKFSRMMGLCTRALCARVELRYNMKQGASCMIMGYHSIVVWVESKVGGLNRGSDSACEAESADGLKKCFWTVDG